MSDKIENVQRDLAMQEALIARAVHQCLFGYGWKPSSDDISDLLSAYDRLRVELDAAIAERNRLRDAIKPFADAVYSDNFDVTVDYTHARYDDYVRAWHRYRSA